jgi:hypothetical protein
MNRDLNEDEIRQLASASGQELEQLIARLAVETHHSAEWLCWFAPRLKNKETFDATIAGLRLGQPTPKLWWQQTEWPPTSL